jgi:hypothetical protein
MAKPRNIGHLIQQLHAEGKNYPQIIEELGCSKSTISYWVGKGNENARAKEMYSREQIKKFIRNLKEKDPCVDCGLLHPYYKMQFDHLPQYEKLFTIANFYDYTMDLVVIINEIRKCELVCANCHTDRTHKRREEKKELKAQLDTPSASGLD